MGFRSGNPLKKLHRYILGEILVYFLLCVFLLTFVLLLNRVFQLTELVVTKGVPLAIVGKLLLTIIPVLLLATLPMSVLIACILAFSRLSNDSEFVAMTASGMSLYSQLLPVGAVGFLSAALSTVLMIYGLPWSQRATEALTAELLSGRVAAFEIRQQVFNDSFDGIVIYVHKVTGQNRMMEGILISDSRDPENPQVIFADRGMLVSEPVTRKLVLHLIRGTLHRVGEDHRAGEKPAGPAQAPPSSSPEEDRYQVARFATYDLNLDLTQSIGEARALRVSLRALPIEDLRSSLAREKPGTVRYNSILVELNKKFSTPFACLILALLGAPLGVQNRRSGRHGGFALSLAVLFLYYILASFAEGLGENGAIPPAAAAWGPNVLLLFVAGWIIRRVVRRGAVDVLDFLARAAGRLSLPARFRPRTT